MDMGIANAILLPYILSYVVSDDKYAETEGFDQKTEQLQDCLIKPVYSVSGSSIFSKYERLGKEENTQFVKYDLVMKQNIFTNANGLESERQGSAKNDSEGYMMA